VHARLRRSADDGEARELPVELDFGQLHGACDKGVRLRIGREAEHRRIGIAQIESRLEDADGRANFPAPIEKRRGKWNRGDAIHWNATRLGEIDDAAKCNVMGERGGEEIDEREKRADLAPGWSAEGESPAANRGGEKGEREDGGGERNDPEMEWEADVARDKPCADRRDGEDGPHRNTAHARFFFAREDPRDDLRDENERGENEVDDEKNVPGDTGLGKRRPHARAEGSHSVEQDVAGEADGVHQGERGEGWRFEIGKSWNFALYAWKERAREPSERDGEKRKRDERVRNGAVILDDCERVGGEAVADDVDIREHRADDGGEGGYGNDALLFREKGFADEGAGDAVSDGVHERAWARSRPGGAEKILHDGGRVCAGPAAT